MRRIHLLLGVLVLGGLALPVSRYLLNRKPPLPPANATTEIKRRYWQTRIKSDVADVDAYAQLGLLEERAGFFLAAIRYLQSARSLGAPDTQIAAPLGRALNQVARDDEALVELKKAVAIAPDSPEAILNLAGFYVTTRQNDEARRVLIDWIDKHPNLSDPPALDRFILAFLTGGDEPKAKTLAEKRLALQPDDPGALTLMARCALATNDLPTARTSIEKVLARAPDDAPAHYFHGLILQREKNYEGALAAWQKANAINPNSVDVLEHIGDEYARRGDFQRAAVALERVASRTQQLSAAKKAAEAYQHIGARYDAAYWNAVAAGLLGDFNRALAEGKVAAQSPDPRLRRRGLSAIAEAYRGLKRNAEYVKTIEQLATGKTVDDQLLLAYAYDQVDAYEKRLAALREAARLAPERSASIRRDIAEQLRRMGRRDEAEKELEQGLADNPDNTGAMSDLAGFYLARRTLGDRLEKATRLSEQLVVKTPDDERAWMHLGLCYSAKEDYRRAARCLEHVIDLEPGYGPGYLELSRVYAKLGDTHSRQEMMQLYSKYVTFEQKHQTLKTRAWGQKATTKDILAFAEILIQLGDLERAAGQYERVLQREPKNAALRRNLRQLYLRMGNSDRAMALGGTS